MANTANTKKTTPSTTGKWIGGLGILIILIAIVYGGNKNTKPAMPSEKTAPTAAAPAPAKKIVWVLDQTIPVPSNGWVELPIKLDGKEHKFAPDTKSSGIEFLADGRYGVANAYGQFDFGGIRESLKARGLGGNAVIYMYTANNPS